MCNLFLLLHFSQRSVFMKSKGMAIYLIHNIIILKCYRPKKVLQKNKFLENVAHIISHTKIKTKFHAKKRLCKLWKIFCNFIWVWDFLYNVFCILCSHKLSSSNLSEFRSVCFTLKKGYLSMINIQFGFRLYLSL